MKIWELGTVGRITFQVVFVALTRRESSVWECERYNGFLYAIVYTFDSSIVITRNKPPIYFLKWSHTSLSVTKNTADSQNKHCFSFS